MSPSCLPKTPWHKFPFMGFVTMLLAIVTLVVDSLVTSIYNWKNAAGIKTKNKVVGVAGDLELAATSGGCFHGHIMLNTKGLNINNRYVIEFLT